MPAVICAVPRLPEQFRRSSTYANRSNEAKRVPCLAPIRTSAIHVRRSETFPETRSRPDGTFSQTTTVDQRDEVIESLRTDGFVSTDSQLYNEVHSTDTLNFDSGLNVQGNTGAKTRQTYVLKDSRGACYSRTISAADKVLVSVDDDDDCR